MSALRTRPGPVSTKVVTPAAVIVMTDWCQSTGRVICRRSSSRTAAAVDGCPIGDPSIPVVANSSAEPLTTAAAVRQELRQQIIRPVLWHQSVLKMISAGVTSFIETGPGRVLSGLVKRAGHGLTAASLDSVDSLDALRHV